MNSGNTHVFGVGHLSPTGAWHLRRYLDRIRPKVVLIEALDGAASLVPDIVRRDTKPPIAILAYTDSQPVRTLGFPLARYSPEYQALMWASTHNARVEFEKLIAGGLKAVTLLAISDQGKPSYNHDLAKKLTNMGMPCFGCSPDRLPDLLAAVLKGQDLQAFASQAEQSNKS